MQTSPCKHNEFERSICGVWSIFEIKCSILRGYKLLETIEIWSYDTVKYSQETKTNTLFTEYVKTFMKIKQEASGWPAGCETAEQRDSYIKHCADVDGIMIDKESVKENKAYRQVCKLVLNSIWGRLAMDTDYNQTSVIREKRELYDLLFSPMTVVKELFFPNEKNGICSMGLCRNPKVQNRCCLHPVKM